MTIESWKHKDIWTRRGKMFAVEISRHYGTQDEYEGPHRWCVCQICAESPGVQPGDG